MDRSKLKLTLILLMITVPIGLSTLVYYFRPDADYGSTSEGKLLIPVIDITALKLVDADGKPAYQGFDEITATVSPDKYKARPWQLLYFGSSNCDAVCQQRLYFLRQLHVLLSGDAKRVQRVYVLTGTGEEQVDAATSSYLKEQQADMRILHGSADILGKVLPRTSNRDPLAAHYIYVMDPVGNIMLYFTPENDADAILKDLKKLLGSSSIG